MLLLYPDLLKQSDADPISVIDSASTTHIISEDVLLMGVMLMF